MVSHTSAIVINGKFVDTVGIDLKFDQIKSQIKQINPYQTGYAYILDEDTNFLVHLEYVTFNSLEAIGVQNEVRKIKSSRKGSFKSNSEVQILNNGFHKLSNGWIMGV